MVPGQLHALNSEIPGEPLRSAPTHHLPPVHVYAIQGMEKSRTAAQPKPRLAASVIQLGAGGGRPLSGGTSVMRLAGYGKMRCRNSPKKQRLQTQRRPAQRGTHNVGGAEMLHELNYSVQLSHIRTS